MAKNRILHLLRPLLAETSIRLEEEARFKKAFPGWYSSEFRLKNAGADTPIKLKTTRSTRDYGPNVLVVDTKFIIDNLNQYANILVILGFGETEAAAVAEASKYKEDIANRFDTAVTSVMDATTRPIQMPDPNQHVFLLNRENQNNFKAIGKLATKIRQVFSGAYDLKNKIPVTSQSKTFIVDILASIVMGSVLTLKNIPKRADQTFRQRQTFDLGHSEGMPYFQLNKLLGIFEEAKTLDLTPEEQQTLTTLKENFQQAKLKTSITENNKTINFVEAIQKYEGYVEFSSDISKALIKGEELAKGTLTVLYTQSSKINQQEGSQVSWASEILKNVIQDTVRERDAAFINAFEAVIARLADNKAKSLRGLIQRIVTKKASPSLLDHLAEAFAAKFADEKYNHKEKFNDRVQIELKSKIPLTVNTLNFKGKPVSLGSGSSQIANTTNLQNALQVVNAKLHDYIKENMGKGNAPMALNYRTGRFARSAQVVNLSPTRGKAIEAVVTYLRNPYDTFAPGGRLHNELRHPEKIIGKSVRQIMKDHFAEQLTIRTRLV